MTLMKLKQYIGGLYLMNNEARRARCLYRINLMQERDAEGNKHLINKLKRILRKLDKAE